MVKKAQQRLYTDVAIIKSYVNTDPDEYGKVRQTELTQDSVPCRLSYKNVTSASVDGVPRVGQSITLFMAPDVPITAGASVDVVRNGQTLRFKTAGAPALYASHLEIALERREEHG